MSDSGTNNASTKFLSLINVIFSLRTLNGMELAVVGMSRHKQTPTNKTPSDTTVIQIVVGGQVAVLGHTVEPDTVGEFQGVSVIKVTL